LCLPKGSNYKEKGNWKEQEEKLNKRRKDAIIELFQQGGINTIIQFAKSVEHPGQVGYAFGHLDDPSIEKVLLPDYLISEDKAELALVSNLILSKYHIHGWTWCDGLNKESWNNLQVGILLSFLPFNEGTWERAEQWLGESQIEYWSRANVNPYHADKNLGLGVDKLLEYRRPNAAIFCLYRMLHDEMEINTNQCVHALFAALSSKEDTFPMDQYHIVELIKYLQVDTSVSDNDLFKIEWAYLKLLDYSRDSKPVYLENKLANEPEFFSEIIRLVYKSKKEEEPQADSSKEMKAIASNAWHLLYNWKTVPGIQEDGSFNDSKFQDWLQKVKDICTESGHLEVAYITFGELLIHSPADPNGLWIHHSIAEVLNDQNSEAIRDGYKTGIFNDRGAHFVDPTGKPEQDLAGQYNQKAEDVENAGFHRLAVILRSIADYYKQESIKIKERYDREIE